MFGKVLKFIVLISFCLSSFYINAVNKQSDSLRIVSNEEKFHLKQLILPASLIAVGSFGASNGWFNKHVDNEVRDWMKDWRGDNRFHADDYIQYVPAVSYLGLGVLGVETKHSFQERLAVLGTSYLAMGILVNSIKWSVDRKRPNSPAMNSFPSGHTATVFMGAELMRIEYKEVSLWYGIGAYTIATGVAFMRLYNDRHWCSDLLAGAGLGILSARIGYWLLPFNRKIFRIKKKEYSTMIVLPFYNANEKGVGGTLAWTF